jgi:hypothetical protein
MSRKVTKTAVWDTVPCNVVLVYINETVRLYIPGGCCVHISRRENLKPHMAHKMLLAQARAWTHKKPAVPQLASKCEEGTTELGTDAVKASFRLTFHVLSVLQQIIGYCDATDKKRRFEKCSIVLGNEVSTVNNVYIQRTKWKRKK